MLARATIECYEGQCEVVMCANTLQCNKVDTDSCHVHRMGCFCTFTFYDVVEKR